MDEILLSAEGQNLLKKYLTEGESNVSIAGCTANVLLITKDKIYVANAGDARCVLYF